MEKLLKLLNEYNCNNLWYVDKWEIKNNKFILDYKIWTYAFRTHLYIISKEYWFIQWLVENDKIDKDRADNILYETEMFNRDPHTDFTDRLLMYLAISDDPIIFLVYTLK